METIEQSKARGRAGKESTMERVWAVVLAAVTTGWALAGCCDKACESERTETVSVAAASSETVAADATLVEDAAVAEVAPESEAVAETVAVEEPAVDVEAEGIDLDDVVFPEEEEGAEEESDESIALPTESLPDVVATVDGVQITKASVEKMMDIICEQMKGNLPAGQLSAVLPRMREQVIRELIDRQILLNAAADTAFSDEEFETELAEMKKELPPGVTFEELLEKTGMDMSEVREQMRIRKMLLSKAEEAAPATDEECRAFFEENKGGMAQNESVEASHILVSVPRDADEATRTAARAKIDDLKAQLDAGADFAELAKANSDCPSKANGGSLGSFGRGMMVPEFEDAAFSQEIGKVGDVVETTFGYHLVLVTKRSDAKEADYEEVKDRISELLSAQRQQEAVRSFVEGLEEAAVVERFDEGLKEEAPALPFGLEIVDEDAEELAEEAEIVAEEAEAVAEEAAVMAEAAEVIAEAAKAEAEKAEEKAAEVKEAVAETAEAAKDAGAAAVEEAVESANDAVEEASEAAGEVAEKAVEATNEVAGEAADAAEAAGDSAGDAVDAVVAEAASAADKAAGAVEGAVESMKGLAESAAETVQGAVEDAMAAAKGAMAGAGADEAAE